jgi:hypothetical protein
MKGKAEGDWIIGHLLTKKFNEALGVISHTLLRQEI